MRQSFLALPTALLIAISVCGGKAGGETGSNVEKHWESSSDPVAQMWRRWQTGQSMPDTSDPKKFVASVLRELGIPVSSQTLVFSKTSLQNALISPHTPRSLFYNEECYVGWAQGGLMELIGLDPEKGAQFYSLRVPYDSPGSRPELSATETCFSCHESSRTDNVRGMLVRSVYVDSSGQPQFQEGSFLSSHESPLSERWGGWYVTGKHGKERHMGNVVAQMSGDHLILDREAGANVLSLERFFSTADYLAATSDIVALMVLEHQCTMHNRLIDAGKSTREALLRQHDLQKAFGEPITDEPSGSALSVINSQVDKVLKCLLFAGEYTLQDKGVESSAAFQDAFRQNRKETKDGRSLKDFQLLTRLFKYRCSYMIYSKSFEALPLALKKVLYQRLFNILTSRDASRDFAYLGALERTHILEILRETKPDLPNYWRKG